MTNRLQSTADPRESGASGLLESALHRPQNLLTDDKPDLADLAACYAYGIAKNHAFVDGNKRTSPVVTSLFLRLNDAKLEASEADKVETGPLSARDKSAKPRWRHG